MGTEQNRTAGRISPLTAWALAFGCAVGWGSFVMPGTTFLPKAGPLGTVLGVFIGGLCMCVIAWNYHVMMVRNPGPGGAYAYATEAFGIDHGFLCAWFLFLAYVAIVWANATALAIVAHYTMGDIFQFGFHYRLVGFDVWFGDILLAAAAIAAGDLDARARVRTDDEIGLLGADFDRMADQLSENITELRQSMERQEQFMGSFAHELKTPMTSIIGYADLLRGQSLDDQEAQEAASYIFSEGRRLEALSLKLLDILMMKHQALTTVKTDMAALISGLVGHLQPVFQENGIVLQCRCEAGVCMTDPDLFSSVLTNLLDNARKAMDGGGNIYVLGDRSGANYCIRVLDNGRGMPETALRHLTDAFYRVDKSRSRAQGGAGLGLTLCSRILELHGGTISFASREGRGTCVSVELPEVRE